MLLEIAVCIIISIIWLSILIRFISDGPETTEIVIFAQLNPTSECSNTIQLSVARLMQRPPAQQVQKRVPRPDDPTPRKPPAIFFQELKRAGSLGANVGELKRVALGSGVRMRAEDNRVFKVPEVPSQVKGKDKSREASSDIAEVGRIERKSGKGKSKSEEGPMVNEMAMEKANKNVSNPYHFLAPHK